MAEKAIHSRLKNHAGLSALVGARIYPSLMPQSPALPAVTYSRISTTRPSAMGSDVGIARARFQVSSWAETYTAVKDVAEQVRAAMQRWNGTEASVVVQATYMENEIDLFDADFGAHGIHQVVSDFEVNYEE